MTVLVYGGYDVKGTSATQLRSVKLASQASQDFRKRDDDGVRWKPSCFNSVNKSCKGPRSLQPSRLRWLSYPIRDHLACLMAVGSTPYSPVLAMGGDSKSGAAVCGLVPLWMDRYELILPKDLRKDACMLWKRLGLEDSSHVGRGSGQARPTSSCEDGLKFNQQLKSFESPSARMQKSIQRFIVYSDPAECFERYTLRQISPSRKFCWGRTRQNSVSAESPP